MRSTFTFEMDSKDPPPDDKGSDPQRPSVSGRSSDGTVRQPTDTPPEHKSLLDAMDRHFERNFEKHGRVLEEFKKSTDDNFVKLNDNISTVIARVDVVEGRVGEVEKTTVTLKQKLKTQESLMDDTRKGVRNNIGRLEVLENESDEAKDKLNSMQQTIDVLSEKMAHVHDLVDQLKSGRLGIFTDLEAPNLKDQYDLKVTFNKSKHSVGMFPVFKEHIAELMSSQQIQEADAHRISVSQFLQLEMAFEESFVVNLEKHYVEIIYNEVDTVYVIFDDLKASGGLRIWQESHQLWSRQTGDPDRDPCLRKLPVPQFMHRIAAMEKFASHLR